MPAEWRFLYIARAKAERRSAYAHCAWDDECMPCAWRGFRRTRLGNTRIAVTSTCLVHCKAVPCEVRTLRTVRRVINACLAHGKDTPLLTLTMPALR